MKEQSQFTNYLQAFFTPGSTRRHLEMRLNVALGFSAEYGPSIPLEAFPAPYLDIHWSKMCILFVKKKKKKTNRVFLVVVVVLVNALALVFILIVSVSVGVGGPGRRNLVEGQALARFV